MEQLPTYTEAMQPDWLDMVAPYVHVCDYPQLCRVSKRFYARFASRIWQDPFRTIHSLGHGRGTPKAYMRRLRFLTMCCTPANAHVKVRASTLALVHVLDFRNLHPDELASRSSFSNLKQTLHQVLTTFGNLRCLLLDGQVDQRTASPFSQFNKPFHSLSLLSLSRCFLLPPGFFECNSLESLVYLDLSYTITKARLFLLEDMDGHSVHRLSNLRILKLAGTKLDLHVLPQILGRCHHLWSIDLSATKFSDEFISILIRDRAGGNRLTDQSRFSAVEGTLMSPPTGAVPPADAEAEFNYHIEESDFSADFSHPDRYLADPPTYTAEDELDSGSSSQCVRLRGTEPIRGDSADDIIKLSIGGHEGHVQNMTERRGHTHGSAFITHLHINNLPIHLSSVHKILNNSAGRFEHFECDRARYLSDADQNSDELGVGSVCGFPGAAFAFRTVLQPNLRLLKIHHSLVTNVPTYSTHPPRVLENTWRSETMFFKQNNLAFPQCFCPDMNPRLYSLTLSLVPRRSTGVVSNNLINFLKLAAAQEQNIERARASIPHRGPSVLHGLRHIRLEFEPDNKEEIDRFDHEEDVSEAMKEFASFSKGAWGSDPSPPPRGSNGIRTNMKSEDSKGQSGIASGERLTGGPFDRTAKDEIVVTDGHNLQLRVWIGSGVVSSNNPPAVNAYMRILAADTDQKYWKFGSRASPSHIAAGAPSGKLIFAQAWARILVPSPQDLARKPTTADLRAMRDVLEDIKKFRVKTRAKYHAALSKGKDILESDHGHWKGQLECTFPCGRTALATHWETYAYT